MERRRQYEIGTKPFTHLGINTSCVQGEKPTLSLLFLLLTTNLPY